MRERKTVCWWLVGSKTDRMAVALDLHDVDCELIGETRTYAVVSRAEARRHAYRLAREHDADVHFDPDSTEYFANV